MYCKHSVFILQSGKGIDSKEKLSKLVFGAKLKLMLLGGGGGRGAGCTADFFSPQTICFLHGKSVSLPQKSAFSQTVPMPV